MHISWRRGRGTSFRRLPSYAEMGYGLLCVEATQCMPTRWGNLLKDCTNIWWNSRKKTNGTFECYVMKWSHPSRATLIVNMFTKVDKFKNLKWPSKTMTDKRKTFKQSKLQPQNDTQTRLEKGPWAAGMHSMQPSPRLLVQNTCCKRCRPRHVTAKTWAEELELRAPKVSSRPNMSRHVTARFTGGLRTNQALVFIIFFFFFLLLKLTHWSHERFFFRVLQTFGIIGVTIK